MEETPRTRYRFTPEDAAKGGRSKSEIVKRRPKSRLAHEIRWVAEHLGTDETAEPVTEKDAPTPVAYALLLWVRKDPDNATKFWTAMYPKMLAFEGREAQAELKMRDDGQPLTRMWEALERERPDLAALSRKRIRENTVNGKVRCPNCGTTFSLNGGPGESPGASIGKIGTAGSAEISR